MVKSTFSLDDLTIAKLQALARKWQVPKTEVLRRAVREAAERESDVSVEEKLAALHELQRQFAEAKTDFVKWRKTIREGRR